MEYNLLFLGAVLMIGFVIVDILSFLYLKGILKNSKSPINQSEDYYQLRLQLNTYRITLIVVGSAVILFGWNLKSNISQELKTEVLKSINIDSLKKNLSIQYQSVLESKNEVDTMKHNVRNSTKEIESKMKNISGLFTYVVTDYYIDLKSGKNKLYFNKLKPINAKQLPEFTKPPLVFTSAQKGLSVTIGELTKEYVEIIFSGSGGLYDDTVILKGIVSLWIIERP